MKRLFSFVLALVLVLSMSVTAFAEDPTGSITITNATIDETYAVYKIFDASIRLKEVANGDPIAEGIAYTIEKDSQFFAVLFGADGTASNTYFTYNDATGSVAKKDGVNDTELIKYLADLVASGNYTAAADSIKATTTEVKFEKLPYGYYLITSTLGTTVTINSNNPDVKVIDKNQDPAPDFEKNVLAGVDADGKPFWADDNSANIGDKITYKISFTATNYDGDKPIKYYQVHDEKGDAIWAEFNSIQVFVGGVELPRGYYLSQGGDRQEDTWLWLGDYDNTCTDGWDDIPAEQKTRNNAQWYLVHLGYDQFRITIPWLANHELKDVENSDGEVTSYSLSFSDDAASKFNSPVKMEITYDSVIEPGAAIGSTTHGNRYNKAHASWTSTHETGSTTPDEVVTYVYGIGLLKDDGATGVNLSGAKFRLYRDKACTDAVYVIPTNIKGVYMVDSKNTPSETVSGSAMLDARETYASYLDDYLADDVEQDNYVVSQVNGKLAILGLKSGTYYLKEVEAPAGYNALSQPVEIEAGKGTRPFSIFADVNGNVADIQQDDGVHDEKTYDLTHTVVHNSKGVELPSTGGEGTMKLITIGALVAMAFAVLLITHKKMSVYND